MSRTCSSLFFLGVLIIAWASSSGASCCDSVACNCHEVTHSRCHGAWLASTESFQVHSFRSDAEATQVVQRCESLRQDLIRRYGFDKVPITWQPKCNVFLFTSKNKYAAVVGSGAKESLGSSLVTPRTGPIAVRRIDLRTDVSDYVLEVLPHELTHVLIADCFRAGPPPLWYDEGLALLADSTTKQELHLRDLRNGIHGSQAFSLQDLLSATQYPAPDRVSVFYGQCASVARCLSRYQGVSKIHEFARLSQQIGANLALQQTYGLQGVPELERLWRNAVDPPTRVIPAHYSLKSNLGEPSLLK